MTTGLVAVRLPSPALIMAVFLVGGLITMGGALAFAELGAMYPQAGGQYVYLREAYGRPAAFLFGWVFFLVIHCGGAAALAVAFIDYGGTLVWPSLQRSLFDLHIGILHWSVSPGQLLAVAAIVVLSAVNYFGLRGGIVIQNLLTAFRLVAVATFVLGGLVVLARRPGGLAWPRLTGGGPGFNFSGFGLALVTVLWAYDGWYSVNCTAEEVKNPKRNIPLSLILGTLTVTVVYLLLNVVYFLALPLRGIVGQERIGEAAAAAIFGSRVGSIMAGLIALAIFGCLTATLIYGPRVTFAMARDRLFFSPFRDIHPRYRVPGKTIVGQAVWASLLCLSGKFQALIEFVVFALVLFFAASGLAVIILRRREPDRERPYRAWGYPVLPLLFIGLNLGVFVNRVIVEPRASLGGLAIILLGIPAYVYWRKRAQEPASSEGPKGSLSDRLNRK